MLGYLDDLLILPLAIALIIKLVPPQLMAQFRAAAIEPIPGRIAKLGLLVTAAIWLLFVALLLWLLARQPG